MIGKVKAVVDVWPCVAGGKPMYRATVIVMGQRMETGVYVTEYEARRAGIAEALRMGAKVVK